jgi:hypothetical protein
MMAAGLIGDPPADGRRDRDRIPGCRDAKRVVPRAIGP